MIRKNIYRWHRNLSLVIAIPVLLWALSGFMHPLMTTIKPKVSTQFLNPAIIDSAAVKLSLNQALQQNKIQVFHNFRIIAVDTNWFYQVQLSPNEAPVYLSAVTGKKWQNGDQLYAQYLAKQFLEGQNKPVRDKQNTVNNSTSAETDCCDAATNCVLQNEKGTKISGASLIKEFDDEYRFINRLLPVYKIDFERKDGIRIYVETTSDRFAYAVDNKRAFFDTLFSLFHNWEFLSFLGKAKYPLMALLLVLACITTLMGLYIFFTTKMKKPNGNTQLKARRNHRYTAVFASLFTLMFAFSGAFHAIEKLKPDTRYNFYTNEKINSELFKLDIRKLQSVIGNPMTNIGIIRMNEQLFWQVAVKKGERSTTEYYSLNDYQLLKDGDKLYALYLASLFSKNATNTMKTSELITKFEGEYGFVNKRLPVWKIEYAINNNERYYIETKSGKLSVRIDDSDLAEGYSFAILHKHHFMDWGGKLVRDISTMFWAAAQIVMVLVGIILWRRRRKVVRS